jgi:methionyl aminopeptidase
MFLGYHADVNATYPVGKIDPDSQRLINMIRQCLDEAIKIFKPGVLFRDIGRAMFVYGQPRGIIVASHHQLSLLFKRGRREEQS